MTTDLNRTFLGVDYGRRRIGIAKSDPTGFIASALMTLEVNSKEQAVVKLLELIRKYNPDGIVVGYPLLRSGDRGSLCNEIDRFIAGIKKEYDKPIHTVDEYDTSVEAADIIHAHGKKVGQDKRRIDRLAAVLILQRFLDEPARK